jgi:hypothetical protein
LFFLRNYSQDTIYFRNNSIKVGIVKEINPDTVIYNLFSNPSGPLYTTVKNDISRIKYKDGAIDVFTFQVDNRPIKNVSTKPINYDSLPIIKNSVRFYFTDVFLNKVSLGYERMLNKKYSLDVDAFYKFPYNGYKEFYLDWKTAFYRFSEGGEVKLGVSRHFYHKARRISCGAALSYRQQIITDAAFVSENDNLPDVGRYNITQRKKGIGGFLKFNFQLHRNVSGIEFFIIPGIYLCKTKNEYHYWQDKYRPGQNGVVRPIVTNPDEIPKLQTKYMKDGLAFLPYLNFGMSYNIKQPPKGWYKKVIHKRDSLRFKRKNIIFYNPIELADGAIGLSYVRVFYKPALSLFSSAALPLTNHTSEFSNGILTENNFNYVLNNKVIDLSAGLNYNFIANQQSFPFIGFLFRGAQFNGNYRRNNFVLNKYYAYVNTGFVVRGEKGFSFLINLALGHYYNDYVKNNPIEYMNKDYVVQPKNTTINSFNFSLQFGYSF